MDRYDAKSALEELREDALLPHPVRMRDMILRMQINAADALEMNREFQSYLTHYGETQKIALEISGKARGRRARAFVEAGVAGDPNRRRSGSVCRRAAADRIFRAPAERLDFGRKDN